MKDLQARQVILIQELFMYLKVGQKIRIKKLAIMDQDGASTKYLTLGNELVLTPRFNPSNQMVTYLSYFRNLQSISFRY